MWGRWGCGRISGGEGLRLLRPHRGPVFISIGEGGSGALQSITKDNKKDAYKYAKKMSLKSKLFWQDRVLAIDGCGFTWQTTKRAQTKARLMKKRGSYRLAKDGRKFAVPSKLKHRAGGQSKIPTRAWAATPGSFRRLLLGGLQCYFDAKMKMAESTNTKIATINDQHQL